MFLHDIIYENNVETKRLGVLCKATVRFNQNDQAFKKNVRIGQQMHEHNMTGNVFQRTTFR